MTSGSFVGRHQEMAALKAALHDAISGQGRLVMLAGEPGIGKTRTAQELAEYAESKGAQVLWGWCYEREGAPPYWPWLQILRSCIQQNEPDQLSYQMGPGAADIAEIVPQVREKLPTLEPPPSLESEQARFRLFDSITTFLRNFCQAQPLILVMDDLHWADKPSLLLLQFLARQLSESRLLVLGCYRDVELSRQHPLSEALAELSREKVFRRHGLQGLSLEDTRSLIEVMSGFRPSQKLVETLYTHTEGNPFFMTEVIRLLRGSGQELQRSIDGLEDLRLPEGVREVIGQRLNRLSDHCYQALTIAAVIGREFDFKLIHFLNPRISEEQLLEVIDEALASHVIQPVPEQGERYQFSHALVQQTLTEELSPSRRVRLHARVGEALEKLCGPNAEAHAAELAHHFAQARSVLGTDKVVKYCLSAGEMALTSYAWEEAMKYFQRGLEARGDLLTDKGPARDEQEAALLFGLSKTLASAGEQHQFQEAVDYAGRAFDYYARSGNVDQAVAVAEYHLPVRARARTAWYVGQALQLVPPDSLQAGRLLCTYGAELGRVEADYGGAQAVFTRSLAVAHEEGNIRLEARVLAASCNVDFFHDRAQDSLRKGLRAIQLAQQIGDPVIELGAQLDAARAVQELDEGIAEMRRHATAALELAKKVRDRFHLALTSRVNATLCRRLGEWEQAREFSDLGLALDSRDIPLLGDRVLLEHELGDLLHGQLYLERLLEISSHTPDSAAVNHMVAAGVIPYVACINGSLAHGELAVRAAERVLSSSMSEPLFVSVTRVGLALLAIQQGDSTAAGEQYRILQSLPRYSGGTLLTLSKGRLLGLLSSTMGNFDIAVAHFEDAQSFCRRLGYRPELAWTCHDCADSLMHRNKRGDLAKARSLLGESLAISSRLGMKPLVQRAKELLEFQLSHPSPAEAYPNGLTEREGELLRLLASGKSSGAIAAELVLSRRTVERHIANVYSKTNTHSRSQATAFAFTHGLVPPP